MNAWKLAHGLRRRDGTLEVVTSRFRPGFARVEEEPWIHRIFEHRAKHPAPRVRGIRQKAYYAHQLLHHESVVWRNLPRFRRFLEGRSYDVAYVFGLHDVGLACALALSERGIPLLWHFGDHYLADRQKYFDQSKVFAGLGKTVFRGLIDAERRIDLRHTAFVSQFLLDYYREHDVPLDKTYVLPRGIDFDLGRDVDRRRETPPVILLAGRLVEAKGFHLAIAAGRILAERRPDLGWTMRIVGGGDPSYLERLKNEAASLGARMDFVGQVPRTDLVRMLREATVFVSASIWGEPFANTIIETLGAGTPLIGAETGSILEVVTPGRSALTYPKNDPEALARALERILDDPLLRRTLAEEGIERIEEAYTLEAILKQTQLILEETASAGVMAGPLRNDGKRL